MKRPIPISFALALAAAILAGCDNPLMRTPPPPIGAQLTGDQLTATFAGNSLVTAPEEVPPLVVYFGQDGELFGLRGNNYTDTGRWSVEDDQVCGAWNNWYGTMSRCWLAYRTENRITLKRSDSDITVSALLQTGNVAGLQ